MAQNQERRVEMKKISRTPSSRGALVALFLLFARFTERRMTCPGLGMKAFGPSRRFSTQLWRSARRPPPVPKGGHSPSPPPPPPHPRTSSPPSIPPPPPPTHHHHPNLD